MSIVVGFSSDEFGRAALDAGADLAREKGELLVVVNATLGTALVDKRYAPDDALSTLIDDVRATGVDVGLRHDVVPDVAEAVLAAATETDARLIVVGTRRRTPVGKLIMGSVGQRVILDAECPVLCVKPPK